jgi:hypothetical protein
MLIIIGFTGLSIDPDPRESGDKGQRSIGAFLPIACRVEPKSPEIHLMSSMRHAIHHIQP